ARVSASRPAPAPAPRSHRQRALGIPQGGSLSGRSQPHLPVGMLLAAAILSAATIVPILAPSEPQTPKNPDQPADQTFLTYPEWFLVFSPREQTSYLSTTETPSRFPYLGHVGQLWEGYGVVSDATRAYPFNLGYHVMIVVIASSTTVEYGLESAY